MSKPDHTKPDHIKKRLDYIRHEIENERVSYSDLQELQQLKDHIAEDDVLLREWAGIPED